MSSWNNHHMAGRLSKHVEGGALRFQKRSEATKKLETCLLLMRIADNARKTS
jgi:hypothetical protein